MGTAPYITLTVGPVDLADCSRIMQRLWDFLDGELDDEVVETMTEHLSACEACYRNYDFARRFLGALHHAQSEDHTASKLRLKVMKALLAEGFKPRYGEDPTT